jgi:competence transcription factor ComK
MNKMIEQMEKSYMGGGTETKEEPKPATNNRITQIEKKPTVIQAPVKQAPVVPTPSAPPKGSVPKVPGVPLPPPINIPLPPKIVN